MGNSFQYPLPWEQCPIDVTTNDTGTAIIHQNDTSHTIDACPVSLVLFFT